MTAHVRISDGITTRVLIPFQIYCPSWESSPATSTWMTLAIGERSKCLCNTFYYHRIAAIVCSFFTWEFNYLQWNMTWISMISIFFLLLPLLLILLLLILLLLLLLFVLWLLLMAAIALDPLLLFVALNWKRQCRLFAPSFSIWFRKLWKFCILRDFQQSAQCIWSVSLCFDFTCANWCVDDLTNITHSIYNIHSITMKIKSR